MEEAGDRFINFSKIKRKFWKNLEASGDSSFFLAYPIESSDLSVKRFLSELRSLNINVEKTISCEEIDEPYIVQEKR